MNGAESLVHTLVAAGVEVCFANPGTSEMHFVAALDRVPGMRPILGLFEGVVAGAADGYGRMAGKPAVTLLHLGPGLANGLANLHNARRAASPVVNVVGEHATHHLQYDAPLTSDVSGLARAGGSAWVLTSTSARNVAADGARAVQAALRPPGQIATLILPANTAWEEAAGPAAPLAPEAPAPVTGATLDAVAALLRSASRSALLLRGAALQRRGLEAAGRVAAGTGARLLCDTFAPRTERGAGLVPVERIPYFAEQIVEFLADLDLLVLVGSAPPVAFFAYPGKPSACVAEKTAVRVLAHPHEDGVAALEALADAAGAREPKTRAALVRPPLPSGRLDGKAAGFALAHFLPEGAIVVDESATSGAASYGLLGQAPPHDQLALTGGSIGMGLPVAVGAAVACPARKVVCLHGDGGAMYTLQALWTMARERLDVVTVIFANRSYAILNIELQRVGAGAGGPKALSMFDLSNPALDWVQLARGMGVEATCAETAEAFSAQLESAMRARGPRLIEARV
jgi:acetolactate synthase-1/2/3 large subunit